MEDYKKRDTEAITKYLKARLKTKVDTIAQETGADKLRVYPILYEMERNGLLKITERNEFGAPEEIEWK